MQHDRLHILHNIHVLGILSCDKDNQTGIFLPVLLLPFFFMAPLLVSLPSEITLTRKRCYVARLYEYVAKGFTHHSTECSEFFLPPCLQTLPPDIPAQARPKCAHAFLTPSVSWQLCLCRERSVPIPKGSYLSLSPAHKESC